MASKSGGKKWLVVVVILLLAASVAAYILIEEDEGLVENERVDGVTIDVHANQDLDRSVELQEKAKKLRAILDAKKKMGEQDLARNEAPETSENPNELTDVEKRALQEKLSSMYDPQELLDVLSSKDARAGGEHSRKINEAFGEIARAKSIEWSGGQLPVSESMRMALGRVNVVRSYSLNLMHAHIPQDPARQWEMVNRLNEQFSSRVSTVNDLYPFLGVQLVETP